MPLLLLRLPLLPTLGLHSPVPPLGRPAILCHAPANKMQVVHMVGAHHHPLRCHNETGLGE